MGEQITYSGHPDKKVITRTIASDKPPMSMLRVLCQGYRTTENQKHKIDTRRLLTNVQTRYLP
jgi:hypothetical protein